LWGKLKAPYHTCWMSRYPGLKAFISEQASAYQKLTLQPFAQPPSLTILRGEFDVVEVVDIPESATVADIVRLLLDKGIH
jgi:hypothetical protein